MTFATLVLGYLGPETMLPMTSAVAGVAGVLMLLGRNSVRWASGPLRALWSKASPRPAARSRRIGAAASVRPAKDRARA